MMILLFMVQMVWADCSQNKQLYEQARDFCNTAEDLTRFCQDATEITNPLTLGLGGLWCAAPAAGADIACQIKDTRKKAYELCEESETKDYLTKEWRARARLKAEIWFRERVDPKIKDRDTYTLYAHQHFEDQIHSGFNDLLKEGFEPDTEEMKEALDQIVLFAKEKLKRNLYKIQNSYKRAMYLWKNDLKHYGYEVPGDPDPCVKVVVENKTWYTPGCADMMQLIDDQVLWEEIS